MITETITAKSEDELEQKKAKYLKEYPKNPYFTTFKKSEYDKKKAVYRLYVKRAASCD